MTYEISDHFDGTVFHNTPRQPHGAKAFLRWVSSRKPGPWPKWREEPPGPPPTRRVEGDQLRVTFVNHMTFLIQVAGLNLLTDPVWSNRVGPRPWIGPRRRRPPGLVLDELPPIDAILLSHNHYDHCDIPTLQRLWSSHRPKLYAPLGNERFLLRHGIASAKELDWWEQRPLGRDVTLHCVPAQHFSGRGLHDRDKTLWCGFVVETPAGRIYFAADTGYGSHFSAISARFPEIRLALLPIGAFRPQWFMGPVHMEPGEAVRAHEEMGIRTSVATHYGTFPLADDGEQEPEEVLAEALAARPAGTIDFRTLAHGLGTDIP